MSDSTGKKHLFNGPLPYAEVPEQRTYKSWCTNWEAWDVPRISDILRHEDNPRGWEESLGLAQLSGVLYRYYQDLMMRRSEILDSWHSPAGQLIAQTVDGLAKSVLADANCARITAGGLYGVLETLANAKKAANGYANDWDSVTTDWVPEWWDDAAHELNIKARSLMTKADEAVRDYRASIVVPSLFEPRFSATPPPPSEREDDAQRFPAWQTVPPIPGHPPIINIAPGTSSLAADAELASIPRYVPAVPGQPVSMLPIPPGSLHAPFGGAYILPGPGVGKGGYIVPMPPPGNRSGGGGGFSAARQGNAGVNHGPGVMPMPLATPSSGSQGSVGSASIYRRKADVLWPVAKGVPQMIQGVDDDAVVENRPSQKQEDEFRDWFGDLAYPWRVDQQGSDQPKVTFRRVDK